MEPRSRLGVSGTVVLVGLLVGVVFYGLRSASVEVVYDDGPVVVAPETGEAVVATLRASGGFAPFGLRIVDSTHTVAIQFTTAPGCADLLAGGDPWPSPHTECSSPVDVNGQVAGLGVTQTGRSLVGVEFTVSRRCWEQLEQGMTWPPNRPQCDGDR
jgi:hypothetical protein